MCASRTSVSGRRDCGRTWTAPTVPSTAAVRPETWSETKPQRQPFGYSEVDWAVTMSIHVNADNFVQAETHRMFRDLQAQAGGIGTFRHNPPPARIAEKKCF